MRAPLALLAQDFKARRLAKLNTGLERVDGETNRTELSAKISGEIEKTQMQARRRRDLNAFQLTRLFSSIHPPFAARRIHRNMKELRHVLPSAERDEWRADGLPARWLKPFWDVSSDRRPGVTTTRRMLRPHVQNAIVG